MRNRAYFLSIAYVYLLLRGERSRELNRLLSYWLSLPKVALHLHKVEGFWTLSRRWTRPIRSPTVAIARCRSCRRKSPALHWNEWERGFKRFTQITSRAMKTWLWIQSIKSKSAKACLLELYEDLILDEHRVCCLLFHRYRPRYHYDITSLLYMYLIH